MAARIFSFTAAANNEVAVNTTPNTYSTSNSASAVHLIRVVNKDTVTYTITVASNSSVNVGTCTILANSELYLEKPVVYTLQSSYAGTANVLAIPVSYKN